jgi:hypothetical protein
LARQAHAARYAFLEINDDWDGPESDAVVQAEWDAADRLLDIPPATAPGVAALLHYAYDFERAAQPSKITRRKRLSEKAK